jgi:hypothetical protein
MEPTRFATEDVRQVMSKIYNLMHSSDSDNEVSFRSSPKKPSFSPIPPKPTKPIKEAAKILKDSPKSEKPDPLDFLNQIKEKPKAVTSREFENSFLMRQKYHTRKREAELKKEKDRIEKLKESEKKLKPEIDPISKKIAGNAKPIYDRYESYLENKNKKLTQMTESHQKKKEEEEMKNVTFSPATNTKAARHKTPDQFLGYIKEWQINVNKLKEDKAKKSEEKFKTEYTFKPTIDKKSERLSTNRKPIHERSVDRKQSESPGPNEPSFRPKITKKAKELGKTFHSTVYDRLYTSFGLSVSPKMSRDSSPASISLLSTIDHKEKTTPDTSLLNLSLHPVPSTSPSRARTIKKPVLKPPVSARVQPGVAKPIPKLRGKKKDEDVRNELNTSGSHTSRF